MPSWKKVIISGSDAELNSLNVTTVLTASGLIYPTTDGLVNQSIITDGAGNLIFGNPYSDNTVVYGKNISGTTIAKGTPLYFTGSGTSGNLVGVYPADAGNPARMPAGGIAGEQLLDEAEGVVLLDGFISQVNTSAFNSGDLVYVAVGGGYTNVAPTGSTNLIQALGYVEKVGISNGSGVIKGPGVFRSVPNIQQGYTWVGNADDVATPTATSSLSVANAVSASFAATASYVLNAVSSSFATSASLAQTANTASYVLNAVSSSFATSSSFAQNTISASYAVTAVTASILLNNSAKVSSSTAIYTSGSSLLYDLSEFKGAMIDYVVSTSGSGLSTRAGTFTSAWNAISVSSNEVTTMDIGNTDAVHFIADATGSIFVTVTSGTWVVDSLYRALGTAIQPPPTINCAIPTSYSGGISYPTVTNVTLESNTGTVLLTYNAITVPDRFIAEWNGNIVIDTGYRGGSQYDFGGGSRSAFTSSLVGQIDPITFNAYPDLATYPDDGYPRMLGTGSGTITFNKNLVSPNFATVKVYAPMSGTAWSFTMGCPSPLTTTTTTAAPTTTTTTTAAPTTTTTSTTAAPTTTTTTTAAPTTTTSTTSTTTTTAAPNLFTHGAVIGTCSDYCTTNYDIFTSTSADANYSTLGIGDTIYGQLGIPGYVAYSDAPTDTTTGPFKVAQIDSSGVVIGITECSGGSCVPV